MALKFEIETLDGVDETLKPLYEEQGGKYRLKVEGIDPADELKRALQNERNQSKEIKAKLAEIEALKQQEEEKRLQEKQEFEKLWQSEKQGKANILQELESLKKSIVEKERGETALQIAMSLTKDTKRAELLKKEALAYIQHSPDGVMFADGLTAETLKTKLKADYPFLVDGTQARGGGANGSNEKASIDEIKRSDFEALSATDKIKTVKSGIKIID